MRGASRGAFCSSAAGEGEEKFSLFSKLVSCVELTPVWASRRIFCAPIFGVSQAWISAAMDGEVSARGCAWLRPASAMGRQKFCGQRSVFRLTKA